MSNNSPIDEVSNGLEELIEEHLSRINNKLREDHSFAEISEQVAKPNDLLNSYKQRSEMFDSLIDAGTPETRKEQIRAMLEAHHVRIAANREACRRTAERSRKILRRSARRLAKVQRRLDGETPRRSSYLPELCGYCDGLGGTSSAPLFWMEGEACWFINPRLMSAVPRERQARKHTRIPKGLRRLPRLRMDDDNKRPIQRRPRE